MRHFIAVAAVLLLAAALPAAAQQSGGSVGLGVSVGAALPHGSSAAIPGTDWSPSFNWGFYVNIPLIYTFHITPSSELYKLGAQNAANMSIAFKFIVPLSRFDLFAGFEPGLTTVADLTVVHVGALAGLSYRLVSNLDLFAQVKYQFLFEGDPRIQVLHLNTGLLFNF